MIFEGDNSAYFWRDKIGIRWRMKSWDVIVKIWGAELIDIIDKR